MRTTLNESLKKMFQTDRYAWLKISLFFLVFGLIGFMSVYRKMEYMTTKGSVEDFQNSDFVIATAICSLIGLLTGVFLSLIRVVRNQIEEGVKVNFFLEMLLEKSLGTLLLWLIFMTLFFFFLLNDWP